MDWLDFNLELGRDGLEQSEVLSILKVKMFVFLGLVERFVSAIV